MGTDRNFNANGVELQSPVSRSARWVGIGKNYEPQRGSTKMVIVMGNILKENSYEKVRPWCEQINGTGH